MEGLIDKIYNMYSAEESLHSGKSVNYCATGAAIKAGHHMLEEVGGKIMVFSSSVSSTGCGKVQMRHKPELFNTNEEAKEMIAPAHDFFLTLAAQCNKSRVSVDLFYGILKNQNSVDLATVAPIAGITGGDVYFYSDFDSLKHGDKMYYELFRNISRAQGTEVALKCRTSTGLTATHYIGSFMQSQAADVQMASIDADKTVSVLMRNDDTMAEGHIVYAQFAMLYTDIEDGRKIRVFNYQWKITKNLF